MACLRKSGMSWRQSNPSLGCGMRGLFWTEVANSSPTQPHLCLGESGEWGARTRGSGRFRLELGLEAGMCTRGAVFAGALAFNGDISKWDVSSVRRMDWSASPPRPALFIVPLPALVPCAYVRASWGSMGLEPAAWGGLG